MDVSEAPQSCWRVLWRRILAPRSRYCHRALLLLRVENLDFLAERLGQAAVTQLLFRISIRLGSATRPNDSMQAIGQGLFSIVLSESSEIEAMRIALRLQDRGQQPLGIAGEDVTPVLTGLLISDPGPIPQSTSDLLASARQRLAALPPERLGHISLYEPCAAPAAPLAATVAQACAEGQIVAFFQPQICCHSGRIMGFEALARWQHPTRGLLSPASFMPGMTPVDHNALTFCMLRQALNAIRCWDQMGHDVATVSVNISECELTDPKFAPSILWELDRQELQPARLALEVLETVGPANSSRAALQNLGILARAGCPLDLDDFGTGYASLDAIRQFGIHRIKIDRSFVVDCDKDPAQQRMVLAILALAERLGIEALAEGVETKEELSFLSQIGCDQMQGFAIARPMPLDETFAFLDAHRQMAADVSVIPGKAVG